MSNVPILGNTAFMSRLQQIASSAPPTQKLPQLMAFLQISKWLTLYFKDVFRRKARYRTYKAPHAGIFRVPDLPADDQLRIALVADWGTGTLEAETVAANMLASRPHYTLHAGDVYFMGDSSEIRENCLGQPSHPYAGVSWPRGSLGSFSLMGNHEMYSGGQGYFEDFLPTLGITKPDRDPQQASFFALETDHWVILGLDTGYHSGGLPAVSEIPLLNRVPLFNVDARLDNLQMWWLRKVFAKFKVEAPHKNFLVLSHHQPLSSFEQPFPRAAQQLAELGFLSGRDFVWLYGHEHRLTLYNQQTLPGSLQVFPRCIGHGGMPVDLSVLKKSDPRILFYDPRRHPIDSHDMRTQVGFNGHLVLTFPSDAMTIEYRDIQDNALLLSETFTPGGPGNLIHTHIAPAPDTLVDGATLSQ